MGGWSEYEVFIDRRPVAAHPGLKAPQQAVNGLTLSGGAEPCGMVLLLPSLPHRWSGALWEQRGYVRFSMWSGECGESKSGSWVCEECSGGSLCAFKDWAPSWDRDDSLQNCL
ncbi:hypothetical protein NDU88_009366 [Pleurodeles waltl]|uniref:Uncharacterized protein n=1 Tax=Pleurodeles waltl TaxID=8319 RepID=A0AAV7PYT7_PLEWA|nr:hypothetical protein NDU88_009366 [Pleurodeles waltl]